MSETKPKKRNQLTNQQFFQVCTAISTHRDQIVKEVHTKFALILYIKTKTGIDVSEHAALNALKATGVTLTWKRPGGSINSKSRHNSRVLARCLAQFMKDIGYEVPQALKTMLDRLDRGFEGTEEMPEAAQAILNPIDQAEKKPEFTVPVKSVPPSHTIPVVNRR